MPAPRSLKSYALQLVICAGMLTALGHFGVNCWDRFVIQTELSQMKNSLTTLKATLQNIGNAYDKLHKDLIGLTEYTENKLSPSRHRKAENHKCSKHAMDMDRRRLHDVHVRAMVDAKNEARGVLAPKTDKTTGSEFKRKSKNTEAKVMPVKNMTTITRYPPKSTGAGHTEQWRDAGYRKGVLEDIIAGARQKCCDEYTCCRNPFDYWKY